MSGKNIYISEVVCFFVLVYSAIGQYCMNANGEPASWWVVLKVPPTIGN